MTFVRELLEEYSNTPYVDTARYIIGGILVLAAILTRSETILSLVLGFVGGYIIGVKK